MRLMTACTKVISRQDAGRGMDAQFRIMGEGLPVLLPYIDPERIMTTDGRGVEGDVADVSSIVCVFWEAISVGDRGDR